jgi:hypothetical protein
MPRTLLEQGDRHISDCMRRIEEQRRRIFELERLGEDTTASTNLLAALPFACDSGTAPRHVTAAVSPGKRFGEGSNWALRRGWNLAFRLFDGNQSMLDLDPSANAQRIVTTLLHLRNR